MSLLAEFYHGSSPGPDRLYIDDILYSSNKELELNHNYIQWLFPNREPSAINPDAPILTDDIIAEFKSNYFLLMKIKRSYKRMLTFLELYCDHPWFFTKNNHNFLRCTRILNCLREFGFNTELKQFYVALMEATGRCPGIVNDLTLCYWHDAYGGNHEHLANLVNSHDDRSITIYKELEWLDRTYGGDYFQFKSGGDGDNGERLMYLLDLYFKNLPDYKA
jgi:hypothetical protein